MSEGFAKLIEAARQGDNDAYTQLYQLTIRGALGRARSLVRSEQDALDIVQDSYLQAFRSLEKLEKPESFPAWLNRIVTNRCKNLLGRSKALRYETSLTGEEGEEFEKEDESIQFKPDDSLDYEESKRLIREIVDSLPDEQRACVLLHYFQELKLADIANLLEIPENTVKSRLYYAKKKIEKQVQELERKGTKLFAFPVFPFLRWAMEESTTQLAAQSASQLLPAITASLGAGAASAGTGAAAGSALGSAAGTAAKGGLFASLQAKAAVGLVAAAVAAGGAAVALHQAQEPEPEPAASVPAVVEVEEPLPALTQAELEELLAQLQAKREEVSLPPLEVDPQLAELAGLRAEELAERFDSARPDGASFETLFAENGLETPPEAAQSILRLEEDGIAEALEEWVEAQPPELFSQQAQRIGLGTYYQEEPAANYLVALTCAEPEPEPEPESEAPAPEGPEGLVQMINAARQERGLPAFTLRQELMDYGEYASIGTAGDGTYPRQNNREFLNERG